MQTQHESERISYLVSRISSESRVVLRLLVRNHPGVMSHVCGLFARRAFNVEGIVCLPIGDATQSVAFLLVDDDARLDQLMLQLAKLEDVISIERAPRGKELFAAVAEHL